MQIDDRFWYEYLPQEMANETYVKRQPEDTDAGYAARHIYHALWGRAFSHFSYVQQTTRYA